MLLPFLTLALAVQAAPLDVSLKKLDVLVRAQENKPANEIHDLDKQIAALKPALAQVAAAEPLRAVAADAAKPLKERVWAVNFLGLSADPGAFLPLSSLSLDRAEPDAVREAAVSSLESTTVSPASLRATACDALAQDDLPDGALLEALRLASRVGCDDPRILSKRAKQFGSSPDERRAPLTALAIRGLARSHPVAAGKELWLLFDFFKQGVPERALVLVALREQIPNLKALREMAATRSCEALLAESGAPRNAVEALRMLRALDGRDCERTLLRELKNADAEVLAEAAETLAALKLSSAKKPLSKLLEGAIGDPRFAPRAGRPDPVEQLARIQRAYNALH